MAIDLTRLPKMQLARRIAEQLGATSPDALHRIRHIVLCHGKRYAVKLLLRTQQIEAEGGWGWIKEDASIARQSPSSIYLKLHQVYQRSSKKSRSESIKTEDP